MNDEDVENEFDESHRIKGALYPYDNKTREKCEPQWTKLKAALSDNHIKNIAITSSYDTGKTSFLKSFFKKECADNEYKFITIPTFSEKQKGIDEENLEKNVINQLLFSEDPKKFPDSRIERIHVHSIWWILLIWATLWTLGGLVFSLTPIASTFWNDGVWRKRIILGITLIISLWLIYHIVHSSYKLSWNAKASLGPVELSGANNKGDIKQSDQNLFILYGDEIKYYFSRSKVKYLILEDMDRFNNVDIFQKLRELNNNINESQILHDKKVVFIYTLSDMVFQNEDEQKNLYNEYGEKRALVNENIAAESKAKFFDYIISIMPFNNVNSSETIFRNEMKKYGSLRGENFKISDNILLGISFYISDMREISCIVADMDTYLRRLSGVQIKVEERLKAEPNFGDKLFAAMIYKNVYPEDFDNLLKEKSNLGYLLKKIDDLKKIIDNDDAIAEDNEKSLIEYRSNKNIANVLSVVWNNYDKISTNTDLDSKLRNVIDYIKDADILRFLLAEHLIEGDFYEYISPSQFNSLSSPDQITFIQRVLARRRSDTDFVIDNENDVSKIIDLLDATSADYSYVYSSSILERFIQYGDKTKISQIIEGMSELGFVAINSQEKFVDKIITWLYSNKFEIDDDNFILLGYSLYLHWPEYFIVTLTSEKYRPNAIKYALDYFAKDDEIESDGSNSLIGYLISEGYINQYETEIENSRLSDRDKDVIRNRIKNITRDMIDY
jgi:hypothetical protein